MSIEEYTEALKKHLYNLRERFENTAPPENRRDRDFFQMVKNETDPIYQLVDQWEEATLQLVKDRKVKVHPHQVTSTKENVELLLMHSYFMDARRKRYMELHNSSVYIFDQILNELKKDN